MLPELDKNSNKTITVRIYKNGEDTGETQDLDLSDPKVAKEIQESLQQQDGEFD